MRCRGLLLLSAALALPLASGCAPRTAERPELAAPEGMAAQVGGGVLGFLYEGMPLHDEGPLVAGPAFGAGLVFFVPGYLLGWAAVPFAVLFRAHDWEVVPIVAGNGFGAVGYFAVGAPLWAAKKVAWDGPCAFGRFTNLHLRSRKGQVDYLVRHLDGYRGGLRADAGDRLGKLTGARLRAPERWPDWWPRHQDEFDSKMRRIRPAGPEPAPESPPAPKVIPAPLPRPVPEGV